MSTTPGGHGQSCEFAHDDAAYVLGALPPDERLPFERHLATCSSCARAVREIAGLPGLLAQVPADVVESPPEAEPVPAGLLPSLVGEVRRTQRRRRWVTGLAAAAAVVVVGAGSAGVVASLDDGAPSASAPAGRTMTPVDQDEVLARLALESVAWGTRLDLVCSYPEHGRVYDEAMDSTYALVVRSRSGDTDQVATWRGLPGRTMSLSAATALTRDDIASIEVRTADGHPILELPASEAS